MFNPLLDRILVKRIEAPAPKEGEIILPDSYQEVSRKAVVIALGDGVVLGSEFRPLEDFVHVGDVIYFGEYNAEPVMMDGEKLLILRIQDVRGIYND